MSDYVAVVKRTGGNDELEHFKYIKREKKNGKWVYYYDDSELKKYQRGDKDSYEIRKGGKTVERGENTYKQTNKLLDSETKITTSNSVHTTKNQGVLSRAAAKGEKFLYDKLLNRDASPTGDVAKKAKRTAAVKKATKDIVDKAETAGKKAKEAIGLDKKEALEKQKENEHVQSLKKSAAYVNADSARESVRKNPGDKYYKDNYDEQTRDFALQDAKYEVEKRKTREALEEYHKTPLGKVSKAADAGKKAFESLYKDNKRSGMSYEYDTNEKAFRKDHMKKLKDENDRERERARLRKTRGR